MERREKRVKLLNEASNREGEAGLNRRGTHKKQSDEKHTNDKKRSGL